jgi:hypothetical protein
LTSNSLITGFYKPFSEEILACEEGITVTLPKPMTSNAKAEGRFGKQDFRYVADEDVYVCPGGEKLAYSFTTQDKGMVLRRYRTTAIKNSCAVCFAHRHGANKTQLAGSTLGQAGHTDLHSSR